MDKCDKPCFDGSPSDPETCVEGTARAHDCDHLIKPSGTWENCNSGGQSNHLTAHREVMGTEGTTELKDAGPDITLRDLAAIACYCTEKIAWAIRGMAAPRREAEAKEAYKQADALLKARGEQ